MSIQFHPPSNDSLAGRTVVLTGGARGIGASVVRLLHAAGAHVFFGDVLDHDGAALEQELHSSRSTVKYLHCDVTSYADNLALFETAFKTTGRIDHAISNAGLGEQGNLISSNLTLESVREEPKRSMHVIDVNLKGPSYFARLASVYLRQPVSGEATLDRSLTFTSSVGGFREDPGLYVYVASKHGVMGLMRSMRSSMIQAQPYPIRTNTICPWMTRTAMAEGIANAFDAAGLPSNTPEDVAKMIVGVLADGKVTGEAVYIEGGRGWKIEQTKIDLRPQWLGERQTRELDEGTKALGTGEGWITGQ